MEYFFSFVENKKKTLEILIIQDVSVTEVIHYFNFWEIIY